MLDDFKYPEPDPNKKPANEVWNARYAGSGYLFGSEPVLLLKSHLAQLKKGKSLDIACGEGRNSVFLAQNGFEAEGIDCSSTAIERANKLAAEKGVTVSVKSQNLDFFLMPLMKYDTVVMTYFRPLPRFFSEIRRGLVHGGTFAFEAFLVDQVKRQPNPNLDFDQCYKPNEVLHHLKDFQVMFYSELEQGNSCVVQAIARKIQK